MCKAAGIIVLVLLSFSGVSWSQAYSYWPNPVSHTNSDEWLRVHHEEIKLLKPKVLVLVADNKADLETVNTFIKRVTAATAEGSRYHGYSDPKAAVQLQYEVEKIVDLRDGSNALWPKVWPAKIRSDGKAHFSYGGLFSDELTKAIAIKDPNDATKLLNLKELFELGIINEVWMVYPEIEGQTAGIMGTTARVQVYGEDGKPISGNFERCAGNGCTYAGTVTDSVKVTMRFTELNLSLGPGCFLNATDGGWDYAGNGLRKAIPEFDHASERFFNRSLKQYGFPMDSLYDSCPFGGRECWKYPNDHSIEKGKVATVPAFKKDWGQGCGSVHFPPNGRYEADYGNSQKVLNSCENYGLHNGKNGQDIRTVYSDGQVVEKYEHLWNSCGGGWQVYMRQSFPGYGSGATTDDGKPMKSWWPYLFY